MKKFSFSLETARRWREALVLQEESKYRLLAASAASADIRLQDLRTSAFTQRRQLVGSSETDGSQLAVLHEYTGFVEMESKRLLEERRRLQRELGLQLAVLNEARRAVELMERIRRKEEIQWRADFEREMQAVADEVYSAKLIGASAKSRKRRLLDVPVLSTVIMSDT